MKKFLLYIFILCITVVPMDAIALSMPKTKMPGGKKNPTAMLIKALTDIPKQIVKFSKLMAVTSASIATMRMASSNPNTPPDQLQQMSAKLDMIVVEVQAQIIMFRQMPIIIMLDTLSQQCGSTVMTAAMSVPYVGTAVAGLCGKIATVDLKVDMLLARAEVLLANALTAKEAMFARMNALQAGGVSGMAQGMSPSGIMPPDGIGGMTPPNMPGDNGAIAPGSDETQP